MREDATDGSSLAAAHGRKHCVALHVASVVWISKVLPLRRPQHPKGGTPGTFHASTDHVSLRSYEDGVLGARNENVVELPIGHALVAVKTGVLLETLLDHMSHVLIAWRRPILAPVAIVRLLLIHPLGVLATPANEQQRELAWRGLGVADPSDSLRHRRRRHWRPLASHEVVVCFWEDKRPGVLLVGFDLAGVNGLLQGAVQPCVRGNKQKSTSRLFSSTLVARPAEKQRRLCITSVGLEVEQYLLPFLHRTRGSR
mmetsp:Transcript_11692/g.22249  ORF Transcript_11692/g.22249 Transcript_11692/m.22249 type:complete len:256 (+) Transcript_11692:213-980(+)